MKNIYKVLVLYIIAMSSYQGEAQISTSSRQSQFSKFSEKLPTPIAELEKAFRAETGSRLQFHFSNLSFSGTVTSSVTKYDNLHTVIIKSSSQDNTLFSISKVINEDKTATYVGRIINEKYEDGYELRKESDGTYVLQKIQTEALIQDY